MKLTAGRRMVSLEGCIVVLKKDGTLTKKSRKKYELFKKVKENIEREEGRAPDPPSPEPIKTT